MPVRRWPPEGWKTKSPGVPELVSELRRRWESANGGGGLLAVLLTGLFIVVVAWSSWFTVQSSSGLEGLKARSVGCRDVSGW